MSHAALGEGIVSSGLHVRHGISGDGLATRGLAWPASEIWLDVQAIVDPFSTSWENSSSLASNVDAVSANGTITLYRPSVAFGELELTPAMIFTSTNGQEFNLSGNEVLGSSGYFAWEVQQSGIPTLTGAVYQDSYGFSWTVAQDWDGAHIGFYTYGATLSRNIATDIGSQVTLTKVSGTGEPVIMAYPSDGDFLDSFVIDSTLPGTQSNVEDDTISLSSVVGDLEAVGSQVSGGTGTGWAPCGYGLYGEPPS